MKMLNSFVWGIIAAAASLFSELVLFSILTINQILEDTRRISVIQSETIILPIILEEIFKIVALRQNSSISENKRETIAKAFSIGIGFSFFEIIIIYMKFAGKTVNHLPEIFGIAVIHTVTAILSASILSLLSQKRKIGLILALLLSTIVHLLYNLMVIGLT